jgi:hypothetical protein
MLNDETGYPFPKLREALEYNPMISIDDFKKSPDEVIRNSGMLIGPLISPDLFNLITHCSINMVTEPLFVARNYFIFKVGGFSLSQINV